MKLPGKKSDIISARSAAICGIAAPITFVSAIIVAGALRPDYDHATQYISALGVGGDASAYVMNFGGFFLFGLLLLMFSYGLSKRIDFNITSENIPYADAMKIMVPIMIGVSGAGYILTSFCTADSASLHGITGFFAGFVFFLPLITTFSFKYDRWWKKFYIFSLAIFVAQAIIGLAFRFSFGDMIGLQQRISYAPLLIWVEVIALRLYRLS